MIITIKGIWTVVSYMTMIHNPHRLARASDGSIFALGETCWRIEPANRFAPIVDASEYFAHLRSALLLARCSVLFIGWEFDTRIKLAPDDPLPGMPDQLGPFLSALVERQPTLNIRVLQWNLGLLGTLARGTTPLYLLNWMRRRRFTFELDSAHPTGASHHQKVVVIDDALAFCGGIDMTDDRWDTTSHADGDTRRTRPSGLPYEPFHDATVAVDGAAATALGDLARERWRRATGENVAPPDKVAADIWPEGLKPLLGNVNVAIARTEPAYEKHNGVDEIEKLYLAAIAVARRTIYIESQYFASRCIALALASRLRERDGPEVVVVTSLRAKGWLEEKAMGRGRARVLRHLKAADQYGRFRIYRPVTHAGMPIYVHAKIMIVDDRILRIGSSNLNNRSMGLDTECDLTIDAEAGDAPASDMRDSITSFRNRLLVEHLGLSRDVLASELSRTGSLITAIETLRLEGQRTLVPIDDLAACEKALLGQSELLDPETPEPIWKAVLHSMIRRRWKHSH